VVMLRSKKKTTSSLVRARKTAAKAFFEVDISFFLKKATKERKGKVVIRIHYLFYSSIRVNTHTEQRAPF